MIQIQNFGKNAVAMIPTPWFSLISLDRHYFSALRCHSYFRCALLVPLYLETCTMIIMPSDKGSYEIYKKYLWIIRQILNILKHNNRQTFHESKTISRWRLLLTLSLVNSFYIICGFLLNFKEISRFLYDCCDIEEPFAGKLFSTLVCWG